jgi:hypothetical protein
MVVVYSVLYSVPDETSSIVAHTQIIAEREKDLSYLIFSFQLVACVGNLSPAMGARNQVGKGLSYRLASLCSFATQFQTRFLETIPHPVPGFKFSTLFMGNRY